MRFLVSLSLRQVRFVLPAAAVLMVIGGTTAAAAAPVHAGPPQAQAHSELAQAGRAPALDAVTWHSLALQNGWESARTSSLITGTPAWAIHDGVVYLRGAVKQPNSGGSVTFATLPASARPAHTLYIQDYTNSDTPGILYIGSDGTMQAYDGNAFTFASLSAVSYPSAAVKSHNLTLKNGWMSSQPDYGTGNPAYAVSHGVVYLSGSMHTGGTSQVPFVLPKAARPTHLMYISVYTFDGTTGFLEILPDGKVYVQGTDAASYTSLASLSFPVASTKWHAFKLEGGWKSGASHYSTGAPSYSVINGVVYLTGSMYQATGDTGLWTDLPAAARSKDVLEIEVYTFDGTTGAVAITNSLGLVSSDPFSNAEAFTSLAGIAYPPNS
jgi:hypothetical protein